MMGLDRTPAIVWRCTPYTGFMAIVASQPAVGTSASLVAQNTATTDNEGDYRNRAYVIKNVSGGDVFLGDSGVTTANGFRWSALDGAINIELEPGEALYGIATSAQTLHVLRVGR